MWHVHSSVHERMKCVSNGSQLSSVRNNCGPSGEEQLNCHTSLSPYRPLSLVLSLSFSVRLCLCLSISLTFSLFSLCHLISFHLSLYVFPVSYLKPCFLLSSP